MTLHEGLTPGQRLIAAYHGGEIGDWPDLAKAIDAAIEAEREACVKIAMAHGWDEALGEDAAWNIVAAIRARTSQEPVREGAAND